MLRPGTVAISAVAGMGGVGKTELATQYVRQHEADYPGGICWLNARESNLAADIVQFAQLHMKLEIPQKNWQGEPLSFTEQVAWCWQNWQLPEGLVLVVLDDVANLGSCRDFLPGGNRFRVLMTTRLRNLDTNIEKISLDVLSPQEALQLLTKLVGEKRVQKELQTANELCEWLGYLPLGLELVGRYVAKKPPNWTLAEMLERLKNQRLKDEAINPHQQQSKKPANWIIRILQGLLKQRREDEAIRHQQQLQQTLSTAQLGVLAAFELSWQELNPMTQRVAALLSLFAPDIFRWEWVESSTEMLNWAAEDVETANEQLYERHLIQWVEDTDGCCKIHPLIREFLKVKLAVLEKADDLKRAFAETMVAIAHKFPDSLTQDFIQSVKDAIPHLAEVGRNLIDAVSNENLGWIFISLGRFYEGQGLYALAQPWLEQCVSVVQSRLGSEHPHVATSYSHLASLYQSLGRYSEAEPLFIQALELFKRILGPEHPDVAPSYHNLAFLYTFLGRYSEAEPLYIQALELRQRLLGSEHPHVATSYNNLASLYKFLGRYSEAEPLHIQALKLRQRLLGPEHPDVASSYNNLASLYESLGRYSETEPLYIQALELRQRLLGSEHPHVAQSYNNLASLYSSQGRYSEAEPLFIKALELRQRLLDPEHPDVTASYNNLASLYYSQGRNSEAEPLFIKALEIAEKRLGVNHPNTITIRINFLQYLHYKGSE